MMWIFLMVGLLLCIIQSVVSGGLNVPWKSSGSRCLRLRVRSAVCNMIPLSYLDTILRPPMIMALTTNQSALEVAAKVTNPRPGQPRLVLSHFVMEGKLPGETQLGCWGSENVSWAVLTASYNGRGPGGQADPAYSFKLTKWWKNRMT